MSSEASEADSLEELRDQIVACRRCPRLVDWRERVAREKRAAFEDQEYWGRPVPGFGDPGARILVVGLAPAAHGANRTGRMFTGDRSGDWLYRAMHRAGLASQPRSEARGDGLELRDAWVTAPVKCAPPDNRPTPEERGNCRPYLEREVDLLLPDLRVLVALGGYAYRHLMRVFRDRGWDVPSPMPDFGHGLEVELEPPEPPDAGTAGEIAGTAGAGADAGAARAGRDDEGPAGGRPLTLVCSYHPSQQNTFTGTLTEEMFDAAWERAVEVASGD